MNRDFYGSENRGFRRSPNRDRLTVLPVTSFYYKQVHFNPPVTLSAGIPLSSGLGEINSVLASTHSDLVARQFPDFVNASDSYKRTSEGTITPISLASEDGPEVSVPDFFLSRIFVQRSLSRSEFSFVSIKEQRTFPEGSFCIYRLKTRSQLGTTVPGSSGECLVSRDFGGIASLYHGQIDGKIGGDDWPSITTDDLIFMNSGNVAREINFELYCTRVVGVPGSYPPCCNLP